MTWAKLDDRFHSHPKLERAGLAATGLYAKSLSYAACYETDGHVPDEWVAKQGPKRHAERLLSLGLWEQVKGGYQVADFLDFNPSRADLQARRDRAAQNGKRGGRPKRK